MHRSSLEAKLSSICTCIAFESFGLSNGNAARNPLTTYFRHLKGTCEGDDQVLNRVRHGVPVLIRSVLTRQQFGDNFTVPLRKSRTPTHLVRFAIRSVMYSCLRNNAPLSDARNPQLRTQTLPTLPVMGSLASLRHNPANPLRSHESRRTLIPVRTSERTNLATVRGCVLSLLATCEVESVYSRIAPPSATCCLQDLVDHPRRLRTPLKLDTHRVRE